MNLFDLGLKIKLVFKLKKRSLYRICIVYKTFLMMCECDTEELEPTCDMTLTITFASKWICSMYDFEIWLVWKIKLQVNILNSKSCE